MAVDTGIQEQRPANLLEVQLEALCNRALLSHDQFEEQQWQQNPLAKITSSRGETTESFHSRHRHIDPVRLAVDVVCEGLVEGVDPFRISGQRERYNKEQNERITTDDFRQAAGLFIDFHDVGNLTAEEGLVDGEIKFSPIYLRVDAEGRSIRVMEELFDENINMLTPEGKAKAQRIKKLASYLIEHTIFDPTKPNKDAPFWQFAQVIDQISTYYFSPATYEELVAGLLNEWRVRSESPQNLRSWMEFGVKRFEALVPDSEQRREMLALFDPTGEKYRAIAEAPKRFVERTGTNLDRDIDYKEDISLLLQSAA